MSNQLLRCNNYSGMYFEGISRSNQITTCVVESTAPQDTLWLLPIGVAVHYNKDEARILTAGDIAVVAVEMCRDNLSLREALLEALVKLAS